MKNKILLLVFISILFFSCSDTNPAKDNTLASPSTINAEFNNGQIEITWSSVSDATSYEIYRKDGLLTYTLVDTTSAASYSDDGYPKDTTVQYAVKSLNGEFASPLSDPSESLSEWVRNLEVSILEFDNKIRLTWDSQIEAESYVVYRSTTRNGAPTPLYTFSTASANVEYIDSTANVNTPYFYQIRWTKGADEYGDSSPTPMGLFSDTVDIGEPLNNDVLTLNGGTYVEVSATPPILYSFGDGMGSVEADTDWFCFEGFEGDVVVVDVTKPAAFSDGEVFIQFYYDETLYPAQNINGTVSTKTFNIPDADNSGDAATLYFKIYAVTGSASSIIDDYSVSADNSL